jgi:hypothetical protein
MALVGSLTPLLDLSPGPDESDVYYLVGGADLSGANREAAAQILADDAMVNACGETTMLDRWRARRDGGAPHSGAASKAMASYVGIGFGGPDKPVTRDHLQGAVAELIWGRLVAEQTVLPDGRSLVQAHSVKPDPLEPGGDGLAIYTNSDGVLVFRLWEIKKHDGTSRISKTINRASKQLQLRGDVYLAKLAAPETMRTAGPLRDLYEVMVELWFDRSERAGVGVAVGTSDVHAPTHHRAFRSLRRKFPEFTLQHQTESVVVAVPDFPGFAAKVEEIVWSGL